MSAKTPLYQSANFAIYEMRGSGILLRRLNSSGELFFQPGDEANTAREAVDALDEVPESKRDLFFDIWAEAYL